jgi:hypothetical protein
MQCQFIDRQLFDSPQPSAETLNPVDSVIPTGVNFQTHFTGFMEMYSDANTVAEYLNAHEGWFCRCAQPMKVEPIGDNGYILAIGRFGSRGYEVEPKIAVVLHPPKEGIYWMNSIPVPGYQPSGYEVDYQASLELAEIPLELGALGKGVFFHQQEQLELTSTITRVQWELNLKVAVQFPKFVYKLPLPIIQSTGDRLLAQIIRQVSPCLTYKVQKDFHARHELPMPSKKSRKLQEIDLKLEPVD